MKHTRLNYRLIRIAVWFCDVSLWGIGKVSVWLGQDLDPDYTWKALREETNRRIKW